MDRIGLPLEWGIVPAERIFKLVTGPDPAAGAEAEVPVPGGELWDLYTFQVRLVNDATVANRRVSLAFDDGTTEFARFPTGQDYVASSNTLVTWADGLGQTLSAGTGNFRAIPMVAPPLLPGHSVGTITEGLQAGDNFGAPVLYVAAYNVRGLERALRRYEEAMAEAGVGAG